MDPPWGNGSKPHLNGIYRDLTSALFEGIV
jgi:hypothetical protein